MEQALSATLESDIATQPVASGLRPGILSPMETLAQSISTIAPTASPAMTVPLVFALAGNGTWLAYLIATVAILLMAFCVSRFARYSSCSGSLYTFSKCLPPVFTGISGWAMLIAYVATAASVGGGFINYANVFALALFNRPAPPVLMAILCVGGATYIAYRDVQVSARLMLWIEAASVAMIALVMILLLWRFGLHIDPSQLHLRGVSPSGLRLGVVLAIFSFVGFESATSLGAEAVDPLRTIPRAVIQSALFAGVFFILCAYLETLGMSTLNQDLGTSPAPLRALAGLANVGQLGVLIDIGALVSMFAATMACLTAAARVLLRMSQNGLVHRSLSRTHNKNATPHLAVLAIGVAILAPVAYLAARGFSGSDIYGWLGSLSVYGFITAYGLAAIALPIYLRRNHHLTPGVLVLSIAATLTMFLALAGTLYPVPTERPYNWLPYVYLGYILLGTVWYYINRSRTSDSI
jgi:amino acid transporter